MWSLRGIFKKLTSNCLSFLKEFGITLKIPVEFSSTTYTFMLGTRNVPKKNGLRTGHFAEGHSWMVRVHLDLTYFPLSFCSIAASGYEMTESVNTDERSRVQAYKDK